MITKLKITISKPKNNKNKSKLSKQLEQEQNYRSGDHMEGYQWERVGGRITEMHREKEA